MLPISTGEYRGADTHHVTMSSVVWGIQVNIGQQHIDECGLPSAASLNCLVSPLSWESRHYPQSSLYIQYLIVPLLAIHSTCLLQCRSGHHYSGHGKQHCILPHQSWLICSKYSSWSLHLIWIHVHTRESLFTISMEFSHHCMSLLSFALANGRRTVLIFGATDFGQTFRLSVAITLASVTL